MSYDAVVCMELIEHVPDPAALVRDCHTLLKPGGRAFFSTLTRTALAYALGIVAAEYILNLVPRGTHDYEQFLKPSELAQLGRDAGLAGARACVVLGGRHGDLKPADHHEDGGEERHDASRPRTAATKGGTKGHCAPMPPFGWKVSGPRRMPSAVSFSANFGRMPVGFSTPR